MCACVPVQSQELRDLNVVLLCLVAGLGDLVCGDRRVPEDDAVSAVQALVPLLDNDHRGIRGSTAQALCRVADAWATLCDSEQAPMLRAALAGVWNYAAESLMAAESTLRRKVRLALQHGKLRH